MADMTLGAVLGKVRQHLIAAMPSPPARIGGAAPAAVADVPALTLSLSEIVEVRAGIGNVPRPPRTSPPLEVTSEVDLADPVLHFPDGNVTLVSGGGHILQLPHGPLVHADGAPPPPPLGAADLQITIGGVAQTLVPGAPAAGQFRVDPLAAEALGYGDLEAAGVLRFGSPLTTGILRATYFLGEYEVTVARFRGELRVDVHGADPTAVDSLSEAVASVLTRERAGSLGHVYVLTATAWSPIVKSGLGDARTRAVTFRFDAEIEQPLVRTGGALISRIDVLLAPSNPAPDDERFEIFGEESP